MSRTEWFHSFKEGQMSFESDKRPLRFSTSRNNEMTAQVRNDRRLTRTRH